MNTQVNNKLIADFLGWTLNSIGVYGYYRQFDKLLYNPLTGNDKSYDPDHLAFHVSWDWIMLAVEKIANINPSICDGNLLAIAKHKAATSLPISTPIDVVYTAVTDFIEWYNIKTYEKNSTN